MKRSLALVHWSLFRFPRLNLDEVFVPFVEVNSDDDPGEMAKMLHEDLTKWFNKNGKSLITDDATRSIHDDIVKDLQTGFKDSLAGIQSFEFNNSGTTFYVLSTTEEVEEMFSDDDKTREESHLPSEGMRTFFAFCDPFNSGKKRLKVTAHKDEKQAYSGKTNFWKPEDFDIVDHSIDITIDKKGFVRGTVRRYKEVFEYTYQTKELPLRTDFPGPFRVKLGYVPGLTLESIITPEQFKSYTDRVNEFGALYVYRDGVRVMPYGRHDNDFLGFEERRNNNVGRYFFSHRRMFGSVYITSLDNPDLIDKAGREGFIKNKYYRGFVQTLIDIFIDLAFTYYGSKAEDKTKKKKVKASEAEIRQATKMFLADFQFSRKLLEKSEKRLSIDIELLGKLEGNLKTREIALIEEASDRFDEIYRLFREDLSEMIDKIPSLALPSSKNLAAWDTYLSERQRFELRYKNELLKFNKKLDRALKKHTDKFKYLRKLEQRLNHNEQKILTSLSEKKARLISSANDIAEKRGPQWFSDHKETIEKIPRKVFGDNPARSVVDGSEEDATQFEELLQKQEYLARSELEPYWDGILRDMERIASARSMDQALGELSRELESLREKESTYIELAQIGLIVEGIDHEYRVLFGKAKEDFVKLRKKGLKEQGQVLNHLESVFDSINERLSNLAPLYRTGRTRYETISGNDIYRFVMSHFPEKFLGNVHIEFSKSFTKIIWEGVNKSVLNAAIVNLVNNALYWVQKGTKTKSIRFTVDPVGIVISDSGPGVMPRDAARVFEPFFSRKPSGRGLGLYLSQTALRHHGMDLTLAEGTLKNGLSGANFIIHKPKQDD